MRVISSLAAAAVVSLVALVSPVRSAPLRPMFMMPIVPPRPFVGPHVANTCNVNARTANCSRPSCVRPNSSCFMNNPFGFPQFHHRRPTINVFIYGGGYGGYGGLGLMGYGLGNYGYFNSSAGMYSSGYASSPYKSSYGDKANDELYGGNRSQNVNKAAEPKAEPATNVAIFDGNFEPKEITVPSGT